MALVKYCTQSLTASKNKTKHQSSRSGLLFTVSSTLSTTHLSHIYKASLPVISIVITLGLVTKVKSSSSPSTSTAQWASTAPLTCHVPSLLSNCTMGLFQVSPAQTPCGGGCRPSCTPGCRRRALGPRCGAGPGPGPPV